MGYYDSYDDDYGYDDQSINFSDYGFKPGPGFNQQNDFSDFPDQPQDKTDISDFPDQPQPKKYETYTSPGTTITQGEGPSLAERIRNAWDSLKQVESPVPGMSSLGASARFAEGLIEKPPELLGGLWKTSKFGELEQSGKTLSEALRDPAAFEKKFEAAEPEFNTQLQHAIHSPYELTKAAAIGLDPTGMAMGGISAGESAIHDVRSGNFGGAAFDIGMLGLLGHGLKEGLPSTSEQMNLPGMEWGGVNETSRPSPFTVKPQESPIQQRARSMREIDQLAEQQILELKMQQSQATRVGDHARATELANDILKVELEASTQKRNWQPPPPTPDPVFEDLPSNQGSLNFSTYRDPVTRRFMSPPTVESGMRGGILGPPIAELPKPIDFSKQPTMEDMAPPSAAQPAGPAVLPGEGLREFQRRTGLRWAEAKRWWDISQANQPPVAADKTPFRSPEPAGAAQIRPEEPPLVEPPDVPIGPTSEFPSRVEIRPNTGDAVLWRGRGYGPVADTNARINGNPVWEPKGNAPQGRTPFERAMRAKASPGPVPEGRVRHRPGEDIVVPNENLAQAAPNLEAAGYKLVEDNGTHSTFRQDQGLLNRLMNEESGTYDPKQMWDNLKRMFGRNPTPAEIDTVLSRQAGEGETTGRVAPFQSPTTREHNFPTESESIPTRGPEEMALAVFGPRPEATTAGPRPRPVSEFDRSVPSEGQQELPFGPSRLRTTNQLERISSAKPESVDLGPQPTQESLMSRFMKDEEGTFRPQNLMDRLRSVMNRTREPGNPLERARELFAGAAREVTGGDMASRIDRQLGPENSTLQQILENDTPQRLRDGIEFWTDYARQNAENGNEFVAALSNRYVDIAQARLAELEHGHVAATQNELFPSQEELPPAGPQSRSVTLRPDDSTVQEVDNATTPGHLQDIIDAHNRASYEAAAEPNSSYMADWHAAIRDRAITRLEELRSQQTGEQTRVIIPSQGPIPSRGNPAIHSPQEMRVLNAQSVAELNKIVQDLANAHPHMINNEAGIDLLDMANVRNRELGGTEPITVTRPAFDPNTVPNKARIAKRATPLVEEPYTPRSRDTSIMGQIREKQAVRYGNDAGEYGIRSYGRTPVEGPTEGPLPREPLLPFDEELNPQAMSEDMTSPESAPKQGKGKLLGKPGITKEQYQDLVGSVDRYSLERNIEADDYAWGDSFGRSVARGSGEGPPGLRVQREAGSPNEGRIVFRNAEGRPLAAARFAKDGIRALGADPDMGQAGKIAAIRVLEHAADIGVLKADSSISPFTANLMKQAKRLILDDTGAIPLDAYFDAFRKVRDRATGGWKWLMESPGKNRGQRIPSRFENFIGLPTALTTTMDFSMPFRQGFGKIFTPEWRAAWKPMFQAAWDPKLAAKIDAEIRDLPTFQESRDPVTQKIYKSFGETAGGIKLIKPGELYASELDVASNYAERLPFAKRPIRASNRAAATFLNHMRAHSFENLVNAGKAMSETALTNERAPMPGVMGNLGFKKAYTVQQAIDLNPNTNLKLAREIGNYVNAATGRGSLGLLEPAARALSYAFFSPRGLAAKVKMLNPHTYITANPFVRKQYMKSVLGAVGAWYTFSKLAQGAGAITGVDVNVNTDWNSADAGKIRINNFRLDPAAGFQQILVAAHRMMTGHWTSSATEQSHTFGKGYRAETQGSALERFITNKMAPIAKFGHDILFASENVPVHLADRTLQMFVPLVAQDVWEILKEDPKLLPMSIPASFGMGTQVYDKGESISKFLPPEYDYLYKGDKGLNPLSWFNGGR